MIRAVQGDATPVRLLATARQTDGSQGAPGQQDNVTISWGFCAIVAKVSYFGGSPELLLDEPARLPPSILQGAEKLQAMHLGDGETARCLASGKWKGVR